MSDAARTIIPAGPWTADPSVLPPDLTAHFRGVMGWGGIAVWDDEVESST